MDWENVICKKCYSINNYSVVEKNGNNICRCNDCDTFLGCKPHSPGGAKKIYFGKYKGLLISEINDPGYLEWLIENANVKGSLLLAIENQLAELIINDKNTQDE